MEMKDVTLDKVRESSVSAVGVYQIDLPFAKRACLLKPLLKKFIVYFCSSKCDGYSQLTVYCLFVCVFVCVCVCVCVCACLSLLLFFNF